VFAIVLAAGEGTRMHSSRPKPLHRLCGRPMVRYVLDALVEVAPVVTVVVVGHEATWVEKDVSEHAGPSRLLFAHQGQLWGTGHAVGVALAALGDRATGDGDVLIVPGDAPLVRAATVRDLVSRHRDAHAALTVLSARVADPSGYGRVVRDRDGAPVRIVEERDANVDELAIDEVNTSMMVVSADLLGPALRRVGRRNAQNQ
jgi:bifunctional UDP-N-acetylglucosamine pyrophosphorylase/glucosamine-1-phosphate N-acetyltransferase